MYGTIDSLNKSQARTDNCIVHFSTILERTRHLQIQNPSASSHSAQAGSTIGLKKIKTQSASRALVFGLLRTKNIVSGGITSQRDCSGFLPIPGVASLSLQGVLLTKTFRMSLQAFRPGVSSTIFSKILVSSSVASLELYARYYINYSRFVPN